MQERTHTHTQYLQTHLLRWQRNTTTITTAVLEKIRQRKTINEIHTHTRTHTLKTHLPSLCDRLLTHQTADESSSTHTRHAQHNRVGISFVCQGTSVITSKATVLTVLCFNMSIFFITVKQIALFTVAAYNWSHLPQAGHVSASVCKLFIRPTDASTLPVNYKKLHSKHMYLRSHHLIFYSSKTIVKCNCVQSSYTDTYNEMLRWQMYRHISLICKIASVKSFFIEWSNDKDSNGKRSTDPGSTLALCFCPEIDCWALSVNAVPTACNLQYTCTLISSLYSALYHCWVAQKWTEIGKYAIFPLPTLYKTFLPTHTRLTAFWPLSQILSKSNNGCWDTAKMSGMLTRDTA